MTEDPDPGIVDTYRPRAVHFLNTPGQDSSGAEAHQQLLQSNLLCQHMSSCGDSYHASAFKPLRERYCQLTVEWLETFLPKQQPTAQIEYLYCAAGDAVKFICGDPEQISGQ